MSSQIPFYKYQGTGNDFVVIDQFEKTWIKHENQDLVAQMCDRKFGIGADGLILLEPAKEHSFTMVYFNADGRPGSLCGNGSRCAIASMVYLNRFAGSGSFLAYDGPHESRVMDDGQIEIKMHDVFDIETAKGHYIMDTGSPHYITMVEDLSDLDVYSTGKAIRYSKRFAEKGINVNFVESGQNCIKVGTYERGVEDETLSCGTGVTASALAFALEKEMGDAAVQVKTAGGNLMVKFKRLNNGFTDIWLCGPAELVYVGVYHVDV